MSRCHVYLVPGFFGFTSLGALNYFRRVAETLAGALVDRDCDVQVVECATQPTGSICRRAERVIDRVIESGGLEADSLHFVGHSTGGLDVRLMVAPNVRLRSDGLEQRIGELTRSVTCVSTPHFGTPLANFFTTVLGRQLLRHLTMVATTGSGRRTLVTASRMIRLVARLDDWLGRDRTFLDTLVSHVLDRITAHPNDPVWRFLRDVASDQGAIIQLTPESMHLFNAAVADRPSVRYASLVTAAPPPPGAYWSRDYLSLPRASLAAVFTLLYVVAGHAHRHYPYPPASRKKLSALSLDLDINHRTSDGIVPTLSQVHGDILDVVRADHLDIVGQFAGASEEDPYADWLPSGSGFDQTRFLHTWGRVADAIHEAMGAS